VLGLEQLPGGTRFVGDHANDHILLWALAPTTTNEAIASGRMEPTGSLGCSPHAPPPGGRVSGGRRSASRPMRVRAASHPGRFAR